MDAHTQIHILSDVSALQAGQPPCKAKQSCGGTALKGSVEDLWLV